MRVNVLSASSKRIGNCDARRELWVTTIRMFCCWLMQIEQQRGHCGRRRLVEIAGRLVAQHETRLTDERARDRHALLLAAGQLARSMIDPIAEADLLDERSRQARRVIVAPPPPLCLARRDERRHQDVLEHRALRQQAVILEHEADLAVAELRQLRRRRA